MNYLKAYLLSLPLLIASFCSAEEATLMASMANDPSVLIQNQVNAITGEPVIFETDLVIQGAEPIRISRAYICQRVQENSTWQHHTITGMNTAIIGRPRDTVTSQLLQQTGMSSRTVSLVDNGISFIGTMGGAAAIRAGQMATLPKFNLPTTTTTPSIGESAYQGQLLKNHLTQLEKYGTDGYHQLSNGRIRYYDELTPSRVRSEMVGRRRVREWDPQTGLKRTWHQTHDENGIIRIVRPQTNDGIKTHYEFDNDGQYIGKW